MKKHDIELGDIAVSRVGADELDPRESFPVIESLETELEPQPELSLLSSRLKGIILYNLSVACNSLMAATSKLAVESAGTTESVLVRQFPTLVAICGYMYLTKVPHNIIGSPEHRGLLALRGAIGLVNILCMYYGLQYLELPDVAALGVLTPLVTVWLAACSLGETISLQQYVCSIISLVGVVIIARPPALFGEQEINALGAERGANANATVAAYEPVTTNVTSSASHRPVAVLAALVAIAGTGAVTILLRKLKSSHSLQSVGMYSLSSSIGASLIIFGKAAVGEPVRFPKNWETVGYIFGSGIFGFLFQALQARALQLEEASKLVNFRYTSLVWAALWEFLIWRDLPDIWTIIGSIVVLSASVASFRADRKPN